VRFGSRSSTRSLSHQSIRESSRRRLGSRTEPYTITSIEILTEAGLIERDKLGRIVRTPEGELFTAVVLKLIGEIAEEAYPKGEVEGAVGEEAH